MRKTCYFYILSTSMLFFVIAGSVLAAPVFPNKEIFVFSLNNADENGNYDNTGFKFDESLYDQGLGSYISASALGISSSQNLNALSSGLDFLGLEEGFNTGESIIIFENRQGPLVKFSVDNQSVGQAGTEVNEQATTSGESAGADNFGASARPDQRLNILGYDESELGLDIGDDIDALATFADTLSNYDSAYFSIEGSSDIFISSLDGTSSLFASGANLGLQENDDLDALLLLDSNVRGVLDEGDMALFSLGRSSFNTLGYDDINNLTAWSPADVFVTSFDNSFELWSSHEDMGLLRTDNIDGLTAPEPTTILMLGLGLILLSFGKKREL